LALIKKRELYQKRTRYDQQSRFIKRSVHVNLAILAAAFSITLIIGIVDDPIGSLVHESARIIYENIFLAIDTTKCVNIENDRIL